MIRLCLSLMLLVVMVSAAEAQEAALRPAEGITDNSFLVEEAYNQEAGVVQHILTLVWDNDLRAWELGFTQEWPVFSQTHQFSYTLPYNTHSNFGDLALNYRWQALTETAIRPAFAPRFSLILPTSDESNDVGYQFNLPVSKVLADHWSAHANAGLTFLPDVGGNNLVNYNLGASAIYAVNRDFNLMLEFVGHWDEESEGHHSFSAVLSPGVRYAFNFANDSQLVVGLGVPLGLTTAAPGYGVLLYISYEHYFRR